MKVLRVGVISSLDSLDQKVIASFSNLETTINSINVLSKPRKDEMSNNVSKTQLKSDVDLLNNNSESIYEGPNLMTKQVKLKGLEDSDSSNSVKVVKSNIEVVLSVGNEFNGNINESVINLNNNNGVGVDHGEIKDRHSTENKMIKVKRENI